MNFKITIIFIYLILNFIYCQTIDLDPCADAMLRVPIAKKTGKVFYAYSLEASNYTYFASDPSFKWSGIDVIATYNIDYDKRISCLAHKKGVRVELILEEVDFCANYQTILDCQYTTANINAALPGIVSMMANNYIDGINLDFEYRFGGSGANKFGNNGGYANLSKLVRNYLIGVNPNYSLSSALPLIPNANLASQLLTVAKNHDHLFIMAYDVSEYLDNVGQTMSDLPVADINIRSYVKTNYIDVLATNALIGKVILGLPLYGYGKYCQTDPLGVFTESCIIKDTNNPLKMSNKRINTYLNTPYHITGGVFWKNSTKTVFSNIKEEGYDLMQFVFENPFTLFQKLYCIGVGGVGVWTIEYIRDMPQPIVEAFYVAFERDNYCSSYIENIPLLN